MVFRCLILVGFLISIAQPAYTQNDAGFDIELRLDHARLIRMPHGTVTIVLGNPKIADITPQKNGFYVLTGKSFGSTNLISQDTNGSVLGAFILRVLPNSDDSQMIVQRGLERETLHCLPKCVPAFTENAQAAAPTPGK